MVVIAACSSLVTRQCLPPVGEEESPALMGEVLRAYGLHVHECDLNEVLRQSQESGILWNATVIRSLTPNPSLRGEGEIILPKIHFAGFEDIHIVPGDEPDRVVGK